MRKFSILILIIIFSSLSFAQTISENSNKIAVINTDAFLDESTEISEFALAKRELDKEFESLNQKLLSNLGEVRECADKIKQLAEIMSKPYPCDYPSIDKEIKNCEILDKKRKEKKEEIKKLYDKRKLEILADEYAKISQALKQFKEENGYKAVFEISKIDNGYPSLLNSQYDVTKEFIQYYKENFTKSKMQ